MALNAHRSSRAITGGDQGPVTQKGAEGRIHGHRRGALLTPPFDAAKGRPDLPAKHSLFKVMKEVDRASPLLYRDPFPASGLRVGAPVLMALQETAEEQNHYTVTLSNSVIIEIASVMPKTRTRSHELEQYEVVASSTRGSVGLGLREGLTSEDDWADVAEGEACRVRERSPPARQRAPATTTNPGSPSPSLGRPYERVLVEVPGGAAEAISRPGAGSECSRPPSASPHLAPRLVLR